MSNRVIVYIDGFNLYHGIQDMRQPSLKWLDLWKLSESFCSADEKVSGVYYFSAYATWMPDSYKRHRTYVSAITTQGVTAVIGQFKKKKARCKVCRETYLTHEEKETDVHIAVQIIADACAKNYDHAILVTGDSDQAPTIKRAKTLHPEGKFSVWTPPNRYYGCDSLGTRKEIREAKLKFSRLPDRINVGNGQTILCPDEYLP